MENRPLILFDTDMDTDVDDAGALAILLSYVKQGRASLLGVVADSPSPYAAAAVEALCRHYGVQCPIGALQAADYADDSARFTRYHDRHRLLAESRDYTRVLAAGVGRRAQDYPTAVATYRRLLAGAAPRSVTLVCVGLLSALDALLRSGPDEVSPLDGVALVAEKVQRVVSMTVAPYPMVEADNFNYDIDPVGSEAALAACPVPVYASPDGDDVITGGTLTDALPAGHPLRVAYEMYNEGERKGRSSWDLVALYYALEGASPCFTVTPRGRLAYRAEARQTYWQLPAGGEGAEGNEGAGDFLKKVPRTPQKLLEMDEKAGGAVVSDYQNADNGEEIRDFALSAAQGEEELPNTTSGADRMDYEVRLAVSEAEMAARLERLLVEAG